MYYVDKNIKNTTRVFPAQGRYDYCRYDMNENPEGLPKEFVDSVLKEITPEFLSIYPEQDSFLNKYAKFVGAKYENVLATNGTDMAIRYILETFGEKGKNVVTVAPSFEMYWVNCHLLGLKHLPVPYNDNLTIDIENILKAIDSETRVVVLLNPNNPVGNVYTDWEVEKVINKAENVGAIVVIDEAYHYFYKHTFIHYALARSNVLVLRTFSKLFSLAACRLGVIISNPKIIDYVKKARLTFDVNSIALLFGEKILDHPELTKELIRTQDEGKEFTLKELNNRGYQTKDCRGNFIFIEPKRPASLVAKELMEHKKILVKTFENRLLKNFLRVSTGSVNAMQIFLKAFFEIDNP